jgi:hypothetical protein
VTGFGLAKLDDAALLVALKFALIWTALIWTEVTHLSHLGHLILLAC